MEVSKSADFKEGLHKRETKHTALFSLLADATGLNPTAEPSTSLFWLCCSKRAGKALHHMLEKVLKLGHRGTGARNSD